MYVDCMSPSELNVSIAERAVNETRILQLWKAQPQHLYPKNNSIPEKPIYAICSNAPRFPPNHSQLHSSVIKDILLRYAHQHGHRSVLYENEQRTTTIENDSDYDWTLERLGCVKQYFKAEHRSDATHSEQISRIYNILYRKNLIYRRKKVMPYCTSCRGPLSNFECMLYCKELVIPYAVIAFPLKSRPDVSFLVKSIESWTLANIAGLCVHPDTTYVELIDKSNLKVYILAENCVPRIFPCVDDSSSVVEVLQSFRGESLGGIEYCPLFNQFMGDQSTKFHVICDTRVNQDKGTGIICLSPHLDQIDYEICADAGRINEDALDPDYLIDECGRFTQNVYDFEGCRAVDCQKPLIVLIQACGRLKSTGLKRMNVPFCLRCGTRLIERAVVASFINVCEIIDDMRKNAAETNWSPPFISAYHLAGWMAHAQDWAISCSRRSPDDSDAKPGDTTPLVPMETDEIDDQLSSHGKRCEKYQENYLMKKSSEISLKACDAGDVQTVGKLIHRYYVIFIPFEIETFDLIGSDPSEI